MFKNTILSLFTSLLTFATSLVADLSDRSSLSILVFSNAYLAADNHLSPASLVNVLLEFLSWFNLHTLPPLQQAHHCAPSNHQLFPRTELPFECHHLLHSEVCQHRKIIERCRAELFADRDMSTVVPSWFVWLIMNHPVVEGNILAKLTAMLAFACGGD
ncbi:hypothetical protein HKD37_09G026134 [Glycine soja]